MREFQADKVPRPNFADPPEGFFSSGVDLEIGAGQGLHAVQYCQRHPERNLIALERTEAKFSAFTSRISHHPPLPNLWALRGDAIHFVTHLIRPHALNHVFILYPNPYPKAKHANLRWHRSPFLRFLHSRMARVAKLQLATNLEWYALEAEEWLLRDGLFRLVQREELIGEVAQPRTHFERKYLARGETCFDLIFEKQVQ